MEENTREYLCDLSVFSKTKKVQAIGEKLINLIRWKLLKNSKDKMNVWVTKTFVNDEHFISGKSYKSTRKRKIHG